jgi:hypothetical protein
MSPVAELILNQSTLWLTVVIAITGIGYVYFEARNTYRKFAREKFFSRVRERMQEDWPFIHDRIIANIAEYPRIARSVSRDNDELVNSATREKQELIVQSQLTRDLERLYIYSSINEGELHRFSEALKRKIREQRIDLHERQQLVNVLEHWYQNRFGEDHGYLKQFYSPRRLGTDQKMFFMLTTKLIEERGEEFIHKQRARIFEMFRSIIQMTG